MKYIEIIELIPKALTKDNEISAILIDLKEEPREYAIWVILANALAVRNNQKIAVKILENWRDNHPDKIYPWVELAKLVNSVHGHKKAVEIFEEAIERFSSPSLWIKYLNFIENIYSVEEVKKLYQKAIDTAGPNINIISRYANFLSKHHFYEDALNIYKKGQRLFAPSNTQFIIGAGRIYKKLGDLEAAKNEFHRITKKSPNHPLAWKEIAGIEKELAKTTTQTKEESTNRIERSIEFSPEYYQAGMSILNYFNTILNQKYPDLGVGVTIRQQGLRVTMTIETPDGTKEIIEKALNDYSLVINGKIEPDQFLSHPLEIIALNNKLELVKTELRCTRDLLYSERSQYEKRITTLESEIKQLYNVVSDGLQSNKSLQDILRLNITTDNKAVLASIKLIEQKLINGISEDDKNEVVAAFTNINQNAPGIFDQIYDLILKGAISGTSGNMLYNWILVFCNQFPK